MDNQLGAQAANLKQGQGRRAASALVWKPVSHIPCMACPIDKPLNNAIYIIGAPTAVVQERAVWYRSHFLGKGLIYDYKFTC